MGIKNQEVEVNLSKSEGSKGNTETTSYSRERYRGQQQQPEREPKAPHKTAVKLAKIVTAIVTEAQRGSKANYTWLSDTEYVGSNHRCSTKLMVSDRPYTLPRVPTLLLWCPTKIFSAKKV